MDGYKHFFCNNFELACSANPEGYFEGLNENFKKVLGYRSEDLRGTKFSDLIHAGDLASTEKALEQLREGKHIVNFINRFKMKTGSYRYFEWNSEFDTQRDKICAVARDVTGRVIANKELLVQIKGKKILAAKLLATNEELDLQNSLKAKRTAELVAANSALVIKNAEHEQSSAKLTVVNLLLAHELKEKRKRADELLIANKELVFQNEEKEKRATELLHARSTLKKTDGFLQEYIAGFEKMLVMTSHGVRQPVANILGLIHLLDKMVTSPGEQMKLIDHIKQSALALDEFTKKLTLFMYNLGKQNGHRIHSLH